MVIVDSLPHPRQLPPTAVALGLFDGLHRGHQAVIRRAVGVSGLTPAVFTFRYDEEAAITKKNYARLLSPALKVLCDHLTESQWRYLLGLWLVVTVGFDTLYRFVPAPWNAWFQLNEVYTVSAVGGYAGYFLLGAWLARREKLPSAGALWAVVLADWAVIALGTWRFSATAGSYDERFKNYLGVFTALLAAALFLLFLRYGRGQESGRGLTFLSENAFGVYLSHPMALALVEGLLGPLAGGVGGQAITFLLALAGCLAGSVLVGSVPGLCFVATGRRFRAACQNSNLFSLGKGRKSD